MFSLHARCGLGQREAEILHYFDVVAPMALVCDKELFLNLSQAINRQRVRVHGNMLPCIMPNGIWKRLALGSWHPMQCVRKATMISWPRP